MLSGLTRKHGKPALAVSQSDSKDAPPMLMKSYLFVLALAGAGGDTIDLGGLRKVQAIVTAADENYSIQVHFLAVACFDQATNREMNLGLGRSFAFQALARYLAGKGDVELVVSGARTTSSEQSGKSFAMTLAVPRAGVQIVAREAQPGAARPAEHGPDAPERVTTDTGVLTRKGQYEKMIAELGVMLQKEIKAMRAETSPAAEKVDALKKRLNETFVKLEQEIRGDLELTNLGSDLDPNSKGDRDQLLDSLAKMRQKLQHELDH
jgi:hypothetical protein